ncbi:hypothetical protein A5886_000969 [Enterococcus sp. 8G7_MSG3316]|uniref:WxL domain-containing protein n=1 Tax=Candidatus Enterococcus testudinis TaxID=1834191 RepID=A0A242A5K8_9ENTE|nr:WxL domain-containing protein [Enterococcus sp. 8G7_MSG3316]OTN75893.1 hypothetical protein A5886_000969 [Enterococcus sp. 8G7_MSG3316]
MNHKVRRSVTKATLTVLAISSLGNPIFAVAETIDFSGLSFHLLSNQEQPVEETAAASFSFAEKQFATVKNEVTTIPFESTVYINEVSFELPEHAQLSEDDLPAHLKASKDQASNHWTLTATEATTTFALPVIFTAEGSFPITVGDGETTVDVHSSDDAATSPQLQAVPENDTEQVIEPKEDLASRHAEVFNGRSITVGTRGTLMSALADDSVSKITLTANIDIQFLATSENLNINRSIIIDGDNQYTLNLGTAQLRLMNTSANKTLRLENIFLDKTDAAAYVISENAAENWELQLAGIAKSRSSIQNFRLATVPEATTRITDGTNTFASTVDVIGAFLTTKEFIMENGAKMDFASVQNTVLAFTRENAKMTVTDGATLNISHSGAINMQNSLLFREKNAHINIDNGAKVTIQSAGQALTTPNLDIGNTISMTGDHSEIHVNGGELVTTNTGGSNILMDGLQSVLEVTSNGKLTTQSAEVSSLLLRGNDSQVIFGKSSLVEVHSRSGVGIDMSGANAKLNMTDAEQISVTTNPNITGINLSAVRLSGVSPSFAIKNSRVDMHSSVSGVIHMKSAGAIMTVDNSEVNISNNTPTKGNLVDIGLSSGQNSSSFRVSNHSIINIKGSAEDTTASNQDNQQEKNIHADSLLAVHGNDSSIEVLDDSEINLTVENEFGRGIKMVGDHTTLDIDTATLNIYTISNDAMHMIGSDTTIRLMNAEINTDSNRSAAALIVEGNEGKLILDKESKMTINNKVGSNPNILLQGEKSKIEVTNESRLIASVPSDVIRNSTVNNEGALREPLREKTPSTNNVIHLDGASSSFIVSQNAVVDLEISSGHKRGIRLDGDYSTLEMSEGAHINVSTHEATAIQLDGSHVKLIARNEGTLLTANSNYEKTVLNGVSTIKVGKDNEDTDIGYEPIISVSDSAVMDIKANASSAMVLQGINGVFNVNSNAKLELEAAPSGELDTNNANATLRFMRSGEDVLGSTHGGYQFNIDDAVMSVVKRGGSPDGEAEMAPAIRMWGSNNQVTVSNGGRFLVVNEGSGNAHDGNRGGGNQGIHYTAGTNNGFTVKDPGSEVRIYAADGPALDMSDDYIAGTVVKIEQVQVGGEPGGDGRIEASNLGYFEAVGRTASENAGIFRGKVTEIYFNNPLFMNYRNNRVGGGNVFSNAAGSILEAKASDLAVWKKGSDLDGDPHLAYRNMDYTFTGANFGILSSIEPLDVFDFEAFGNAGMASYARLSSNNARWSILAELRVPTNADKRIHGQVDMPVGIYDSRPAWQDEVKVTVEIERNGETIQTVETFTQGHTNEHPGISIYGEAARGGLFEIELDDYLQAGDVVRVSDLEVMAGAIQEGFENIYEVDEVTVFPIVPPTPAAFPSETIPVNATEVTGTTDNPDVEVTITHNGQTVTVGDVQVSGVDNQFAIPVEHLNLSVGDEIQVFLRDQHGSAQAAGVVNPPITNNNSGNINPVEALDFRDATFSQATILIVGEMVEGELTIDRATDWDFGQHPLTSRAMSYDALPFSTQSGGETTAQANFVQVTDARAASETSSWRLYVSQLNQFSSAAHGELEGAQLSWKNGRVLSSNGQTANESNFGIVRTGGTLIPGGESIQLISTNIASDKGTWYYAFGDETTKDSSISLAVPSGAKTRGARYTTTINYSFNAVPSECFE